MDAIKPNRLSQDFLESVSERFYTMQSAAESAGVVIPKEMKVLVRKLSAGDSEANDPHNTDTQASPARAQSARHVQAPLPFDFIPDSRLSTLQAEMQHLSQALEVIQDDIQEKEKENVQIREIIKQYQDSLPAESRPATMCGRCSLF